MMSKGQMRAMRLVPLLAVLFVLSACAVSTPASITSTKASPQAITNIELLSENRNAGLRAQFFDDLTNTLQSRGVSIQTGAPHVADFAVSQRQAGVGLQSISQDSDAAEPIEPPFKQRWYHKCKPNRVSASLVIYARSNGAVQAKASGEFLACPGDMSQLEDLAQVLVDRTLGN